MSQTPPAGFVALPERYQQSFIGHVGPFMSRRETDGARSIGLFLEPRHCNPFGESHGGFLAALADFACAYVLLDADDPQPSVVTIQMGVQMIASARLGEWLTARAHIRRRGRSIAHVGCAFTAGDRLVAHADAVFRVLSAAGTTARRHRAGPT